MKNALIVFLSLNTFFHLRPGNSHKSAKYKSFSCSLKTSIYWEIIDFSLAVAEGADGGGWGEVVIAMDLEQGCARRQRLHPEISSLDTCKIRLGLDIVVDHFASLPRGFVYILLSNKI